MDKLIELIKSKSFSAAEKLLRKELALSPNNCYLLTQLANVLWNRCKDEEALSYADKAKEVCPVMLLLNYTRGRILWSLEKYEQSIEEWYVVLNMTIEEVAENGYDVRWAKSVINDSRYYKAGCLTYAKAAFEQEPNDPLVKYDYAVALMFNGLSEDALLQFEELVALGLDYIAFSEHGEGVRWAKKLLRNAQKQIDQIQASQQ